MTKKQIPRLMRSVLLNRVYIATKYDVLGAGEYLTTEKFDVTAEFELMALAWLSHQPDKVHVKKET